MEFNETLFTDPYETPSYAAEEPHPHDEENGESAQSAGEDNAEDPVRTYLREMGSIALLNRRGEGEHEPRHGEAVRDQVIPQIGHRDPEQDRRAAVP